MTQNEKFYARVMQSVAASRNGIMTIQAVIVDGVPILWSIQQPIGAEGYRAIVGGECAEKEPIETDT